MTYNHQKVSCEECGKMFPAGQRLKVHILKAHTDEHLLPFKCGICLKGFAKKSDCNSHISVHTGERNFSCQYCDHKSRTKQMLKQHESEVHEGKKRKRGDVIPVKSKRKRKAPKTLIEEYSD